MLRCSSSSSPVNSGAEIITTWRALSGRRNPSSTTVLDPVWYPIRSNSSRAQPVHDRLHGIGVILDLRRIVRRVRSAETRRVRRHRKPVAPQLLKNALINEAPEFGLM